MLRLDSRRRWPAAIVPFAACLLATAAPAVAYTAGAAFLAENEAAMQKMHRDMHVSPTGDADLDFVAMMIPHHQGAIDMAVAVLKYGKNQRVRRLAQEIIIEQRQEIDAMRLAIGAPLAIGGPAPTVPARAAVSTAERRTP